MANMEELANVINQLQQQVMQTQQENQNLRDRMTNYETQAQQAQAHAAQLQNQLQAQAAGSPAHGGQANGFGATEVLRALQGLPEALAKMSKPKALFDVKGLGKPQTLGDDAEAKFRLWSVKLEDYVFGVYGGKSREVLEWASSMETEVTDREINNAFGAAADLLDQWDDIEDFNSQLYSVLRATTEGIPWDVVENSPTGAGLGAWRNLHRRFDPSTGSRKRTMLHALTNPERANYETLQSALERWKMLRSRYDRKRDQFGAREALPESLAMNALEKLVPNELEQHLLLNFARFRTFEEMEREVVNYIEAKTGNKMIISSNFAKAASSSQATPMDVDGLVRVVTGSISSLAKTKGDGKGKGSSGKPSTKFEGTCNNCGKYGHRSRDCWSVPAKGQSGGKGASSSRSASASPKKEKFTGKCNYCGKPGHKKADCRAFAAKGKGKGPSGGSQPKAVASVESHPEPEPASASGLELCSLEVDTLTVVSRGDDASEGIEEEEPARDETVEPNANNDIPSRRSSTTRSSRRRTSRTSRSSRSRSRAERAFRADASRSRTTSPLSPSRRRVRINNEAEHIDYPVDDENQPDYVNVPVDDSGEADREEPFEEWSPSEVASVTGEEPKWIKCNLDTGASLTVFPKDMFENLEPVGMRLRTASGEIVNGYGRASIRGEDVMGTMRKLTGNVADVHKPLISAAAMHRKGYSTGRPVRIFLMLAFAI
eukprot:s305_g17.t1